MGKDFWQTVEEQVEHKPVLKPLPPNAYSARRSKRMQSRYRDDVSTVSYNLADPHAGHAYNTSLREMVPERDHSHDGGVQLLARRESALQDTVNLMLAETRFQGRDNRALHMYAADAIYREDALQHDADVSVGGSTDGGYLHIAGRQPLAANPAFS